ncbi:MAG: S-layer homology domain-containing protein [Oscillospiraceae bacterium]|nr:S-layer homology domain-containing protein [Oscillospiraceae bacterium]
MDGTWWMQAIRAYDMELLVNNSYSGDKLNQDKSGKGLTRCRQLHGRNGQHPDVIFIYFGTNDAGGHKVVENNLEVFRGNYPKLMDSLAADYPQAQVYFFTLLPRTEFDNTPYSDVIRQLVTQSANPNFHLVDIQKESGITLANLANYTVDGNLHPNKVGMTKLADTLVTAMEQSLQGMETTNGSNLVLSGSGQASLALDTPVSGVRASMSVCFERFGGGVGLYWDNRCVISLRTGKDGRMEYFADGVWTAVKGQKLETGRRYELSLESAANSTRTVISLDGKAIVDVKLGLGEDTHTCPGGMMQDVTDDVWYHEAVDYALANSLMSGYSAAAFGPNDTLTRAMVVQVLYNKEGKPARAADHTFPDVKAGDWYNNAVAWAAERKVVSGYGDGRFGPNDAVTLEQVLVILWNYSGNPALTGDADAVGPHSDWAGNAIGWAQAAGVLENVPFDTVTAPATRAQTAQMLMNYIKQ